MSNDSQSGATLRQIPADEREKIRQAARESVDRMMVNSEELKKKMREAVRPSSPQR